MNEMTLKKEECQRVEETYIVKNDKVSDMAVGINGVGDEQSEVVLYRTNGEYNVKLHFQKNDTDVIGSIQTVLRQEYISKLNEKEGNDK